MSDLQIALLLIGIFIVAAVLIFNWNQERRFKKQAAAAFQPPAREPLAERSAVPRATTDRVEPGLREPVIGNLNASVRDIREPHSEAESAPEPLTSPAPLLTSRSEAPSPSVLRPQVATPRVSSGDAAGSPASSAVLPIPVAKVESTPVAPAPPAPYDELMEYRIHIVGEGILAAVFAEDINRARSLGKTTRWLGFPVKGIEWEEIQPWREVFYREVQVTLQLADRNGAVQQDELIGLCSLLQTTAQTHGLKIVCDDAAEALQRAQSVDVFCVDVDVLIGLNVIARGEGAMKLTKVLKEVETTGMVLGIDGAYRLLDSRGEALYTLCNHDAEPFSHNALQQDTQAVTLQFDVPRVPDGLKVFDGMVSFGRKLANEVGGLLVDDNMRPLTEGGIDKIRQQLASIYQRMEARGVPSGSRRALRLFS